MSLYSPPCLSVLVHVHVYISVILVIHGSHYNPGCQSHIMPVTKILTSDHPWLSIDRQYESNPCQSIHACHCNHNSWLSRDCQYESNPCQSIRIHACHCNHDNPGIVNMKATLIRVSMPITVTLTILGCPWIIYMKATSVRVCTLVTVTMTILGCPGIINMKATSVRVSISTL